MRSQFVLSELWIGLRRNLTMTIAVIITVAVSLWLFGMALLIRSQVDTMKGYWYGKVEVSIFLKDNVTQDQREQLQRDLEAMPEVQHVFYEGHDEAYARFKEQFKSSPAIVQNTTADQLPESFRVKLENPRKFDVVASAFEQRPGVANVINQRELLRNFFTVLNGISSAVLVFSAVMLVAAAVLIANTVRLAAFSRRRETGIMRLVGASNLYIQLPFLLEGALAGLVGAVLAVGMVAATKAYLIDHILRPAIKFTPFIGWDAVVAQIPILVLIGVALSAGAAFVTLRRYLRV